MKTINLAKRWSNRVNATTVHEYSAGWSGQVSNETAERAEAAGVLDGKPAEVRAPRAASTKKPAAKKASVKTPALTPAPAPAEAPAEPQTEA